MRFDLSAMRWMCATALALVWAWSAASAPLGMACEIAYGTHPFHETLTQIEQNSVAGTLEVAIRIDAVDLDQMIERWLGQRIDLERDVRAERSMELWLRERLAVRLPSGERASMTWIGHEFEGPFCWLYVEFAVARDEPFVDLAHLVLFDWHPGPVNRIVGVGTLRGVSLATTPDRPVVRVRLNEAPTRTPLRVLMDLLRGFWSVLRLSTRGLLRLPSAATIGVGVPSSAFSG